ncbi:HpcH/HpaI aldolase/citrate lyase family protein [Nocardioides sp. Bht2]|uniref:HpcH/HpaI aldolase/citrate lyase family protein n=1 Tax=Nocardioides sp. Bht2 TaxID=3392297 RepID=UPI0039B5EFE1
MTERVLPRSYLYVPGNAAEKLARAAQLGADALIVDLEDAVPLAEKDAALEAVCRWLSAQPIAEGPEIWVRINSGSRRRQEVRALAGVAALRGLAVAKAESEVELAEIDAELSAAGDHETLLMPLLESAAAVLAAPALAASARVCQLQIGEVDLAGDVGLEPGSDEAELAPLRAMAVLASAAAGIQPPPAPVSVITKDPDAFLTSTRQARRQGFVGRCCIHPAQVALVHEVFAPTEAEVAEAESVIALLAKAEAEGSGVVLDAAGRMIDAAVLRRARKILALHAQAVG